MKLNKLRNKIAKWLDECVLAAKGIVIATRNWKFLVVAGVSFLVFGILMNLLSDGFASFNLMGQVGLWGSLKIIWDACLGVFGVGRNFWDWLVVFVVALIQGTLIGMVALVWKKKQRDKKDAENSANAQSAGLAAGLAVLGTGCPTCGTSLLTPIIGTIFSSGSYAVAGVLSGIVTAIAVLVALLTLKKIGLECYIIIVSERYKRKRELLT